MEPGAGHERGARVDSTKNTSSQLNVGSLDRCDFDAVAVETVIRIRSKVLASTGRDDIMSVST